jgi:hypothetical protein
MSFASRTGPLCREVRAELSNSSGSRAEETDKDPSAPCAEMRPSWIGRAARRSRDEVIFFLAWTGPASGAGGACV